ncbi:MAG: hypothetical protein RLY16_2476, partial [Bacteroidota bacterium]
MRKHFHLFATFASLWFLISCNQANQQAPLNAADSVALPTVNTIQTEVAKPNGSQGDSANPTHLANVRPVWNQLLIRNAELTLQAKSASILVSKIYQSTESAGGFVLSENQTT